MYKRIIFFLFILSLGFLIFYTSSQGYVFINKVDNKIFNGNFGVIKKLDRLIFELDVRRVFRKFILTDDHYIDLKLSRGDMEHLQTSKENSIEQGFISDNSNPWRTGEILIDKDLVKVKFKLHGTSVTPLRRGGLSFRLKHKAEPPYYLNMRHFKLITAYDDADISTIVINNLANKFGLIAINRNYKGLRINGNDLGLYQLEEYHSKEWFEKNSKLTNYTIIKSNDDWDRKESGAHVSNTDLWVENKELKTSSDDPEIALGALEKLLIAIRNESTEEIKNLIDVDYWAKFVAFFSIINNSHPVTGDNLRYIYDHTRGKFLVLFRLEDQINPLENNLEQFSHSWLQNPKEYNGSDTHKLFSLLLRDASFNSQKNRYIFQLVQKKEKFLGQAKKLYDENYELLKYNSNDLPRHKISHDMKIFFENLENNFTIAQDYLEYQKTFVTIEVKNSGTQIDFINDSFQELLLKTIQINKTGISSNKPSEIGIDRLNMDVIIKQAEIGEDFTQQVAKQSIFISSEESIQNFDIRNLTTGEKLKENDIYINQKKTIKFFSNEESFKSLEENNIDFEESSNNTIIIKSGNYTISKNVIIPNGYSLNIEPGTTFRLKENISLFAKGDLNAVGNKDHPIVFTAADPLKPFGALAIIGRDKPVNVQMKHLNVNGGSEATIEGIRFLGQLSIHNSNFQADSITLENSFSDDGGNIRNSQVEITKSSFINNQFDQLDLDFCNGKLDSNIFEAVHSNDISNDIEPNGDGIDLSGSTIILKNNIFSNFRDKGASIGEESTALFIGNDFRKNNKAIAIKDGSSAYFLTNNLFDDNVEDFSIYIKKPFYGEPQIYIDRERNDYKFAINKGSINELDLTEVESIFKLYEN